MKVSTIQALNALNQRFYETVAADFDATRQQAWEGWEELLNYLPPDQKELRILDIGCGNGRFGRFLAEKLPETQIQYIGLDNSQKLLTAAQEALSQTSLKFELHEFDIVTELLQKSFVKTLQLTKPDLVMLSGVMHHLPSYDLRRELLLELHELSGEKIQVVITNWLFMDVPKLAERVINPQQVQIEAEDLEFNDYILDWQRGQTAYRYCHYMDEPELKKLLYTSVWELKKTWYADGATHQLNRYSLLEPVNHAAVKSKYQ